MMFSVSTCVDIFELSNQIRSLTLFDFSKIILDSVDRLIVWSAYLTLNNDTYKTTTDLIPLLGHTQDYNALFLIQKEYPARVTSTFWE